jgi:hypothetical protein
MSRKVDHRHQRRVEGDLLAGLDVPLRNGLRASRTCASADLTLPRATR